MSAWGQHAKVQITDMCTPFGTSQYNQAVALEEVFKRANSWLLWKAQETPGAMYISRYRSENYSKILSGEIPQITSHSSAFVIPFIVEGRPPFQKLKNPNYVAIFSLTPYINFFVTFDPNIKTLKDLVGKRVGISEKSRPFQSTLPLKPYFEKGLDIWDKVDWQYLGVSNSKDALLNNKIDAHYASTFMGSVTVAADGSYVATGLAPGAPDMELMNSGRKMYYIGFDPDVYEKGWDVEKDGPSYPILIKKGTLPGLDHDIYGKMSAGILCGDSSLPDDVVQEMIRVRHKYREELGKYDGTLKYLPDTPYPIGTPGKWVHPGVKKAMKNLGIPLPGKEQ
ncbi:MAG: ABC transporter substrate-binding protein [Deltaproteobacteria bacterium]|nr:ABC transporter substrate-binding protein [Deltaproteobacteria bacterium]